MPSIRLKDIVITVAPAAAEAIRNDFITWQKIDPANLLSKLKPDARLDAAMRSEEKDVKERLSAILKDGQIDHIEAPKLFELFKHLAGEDHILSQEEAESSAIHIFLKRHNYSLSAVAIDMTALLDNGVHENTLAASRELINLGFASDYLKEDKERISNILDRIRFARDQVDALSRNVDLYLRYLMDKELSYLNFISAENFWGIASWFGDGRTLTSLELDGALKVASWLRSVRNGLDQFEYRLKDGIVSDRGEDVKAALYGPYEYILDLVCSLGAENCSNTISASVYTARDVIGRIYELGAEKFSLHVVNGMSDFFEAELRDILMDRLPGRLERFRIGGFTTFANSFASLDSLASLAIGMELASILSRSAYAASAVSAASKAVNGAKYLKNAKYLIPGVTAFSSKGFFQFLGNAGIEAVKAGGYIGTASLFGENAGRIAGNLYNFILGGVSTFDSAIAANTAKALKAGADAERAVAIYELRNGPAEKSAGELARFGDMRSFRLAGSKAAPETVKFYARKLKDIRIGADAARRRINERLASFERETRITFARIIKRLEGGGTGSAAKPVRPSGLTRVEKIKGYRPPVRAKTKEAIVERPPARAVKEPSEFERLIADPPDNLDIDLISKLTGGKISFSGRGTKAINDVYIHNPSWRAYFWRNLAGLNSKSIRGWKRIGGTDGGFYSRISRYYRVLAVRENGGFRITNVIHRGQLHDGYFLKDFL